MIKREDLIELRDKLMGMANKGIEKDNQVDMEDAIILAQVALLDGIIKEDEIAEQKANEVTEIVFILDKSGSMNSIKQDAIGGFNSFIEEQKKVEGKANVTLILFDNNVEVVYESVDINNVGELNGATYVPSGMTAMLDAIGIGIDGLNKRIGDKKLNNVIFAIMTDGMENASREYHGKAIKERIEKLQKEKDYQFIFLGANIDAIGTAESIGIKGMYAGNFIADGLGATRSMTNASEMVVSYRTSGQMMSYVEADELSKLLKDGKISKK